MKIYGYPIAFAYKGYSCRTESEAIALRKMIASPVSVISITEHRDEHNSWWKVEPCPLYTYTTNQAEAEWQRSNSRCYQDFRDFNILQAEVQPVGLLKENNRISEMIVCGEIPLYRAKRFSSFSAIRLQEYSPINSSVRFTYTLPDSIPLYSQAANQLICDIKGADGGELVGLNFQDLIQVEELISTRTLIKNALSNPPYSTDQVECRTYQKKDNTRISLYVYSVGYSEGYAFEVYLGEKEAKRAFYANIKERLKSNWVLLECFECGAIYEETGYVIPGGMGCDRCS